MKTRDPIAVTSRPMTIRELLDVADGARIELSPDAVAVIADSRAVVESGLASGRVAIGRGEAELDGEQLAGADALRRAGIAPLQPRPKDGLALMSANGISVGHGAVIVARARHVLAAANIAAAFSLEAMSGNVSPFDPEVAAAKGVRGQAVVSVHVRDLLQGSYLHDENAN